MSAVRGTVAVTIPDVFDTVTCPMCAGCPTHQQLEAGQCVCIANYYADGAGGCTACTGGQISDVGSSLSSDCRCPADKVLVAGQCVCAVDMFADPSSLSGCSACPAGSSSSPAGVAQAASDCGECCPVRLTAGWIAAGPLDRPVVAYECCCPCLLCSVRRQHDDGRQQCLHLRRQPLRQRRCSGLQRMYHRQFQRAWSSGDSQSMR